MTKNIQSRSTHLRIIYEFLFSFNLGLVAVLQKSLTTPFFLLLRLKVTINNYLHLSPHSDTGGYAASLAIAFILALAVFMVVRLLSVIAIFKEVMRPVAGIVSLAALPLCWFGKLPAAKQQPTELKVYLWPLTELAGAVGCTLLYLYRKWLVPWWATASLLALHFSYWSWRFFGFGSFFDPRYLVFPSAGLASCLAWGLHVSNQRQSAARADSP